MWRGPYRYIYDQRRYRVSFYLAATTRLSRAGPGSDFRHEWHKLKHQVPPRGGHSEKKKKQQPSMFIIICQCTKNGKAVSEGGMKHWGSGCSYCDANVAVAQAHDFTWKQTKQQNGGFRTRCLILIKREPKTTDHFTASAHREPEGFKLKPGWYCHPLTSHIWPTQDSDVTWAALFTPHYSVTNLTTWWHKRGPSAPYNCILLSITVI